MASDYAGGIDPLCQPSIVLDLAVFQASNVCNAALLREKGVAALVELCRKDNRNLQNLAATALNNISYDAPRR